MPWDELGVRIVTSVVLGRLGGRMSNSVFTQLAGSNPGLTRTVVSRVVGEVLGGSATRAIESMVNDAYKAAKTGRPISWGALLDRAVASATDWRGAAVDALLGTVAAKADIGSQRASSSTDAAPGRQAPDGEVAPQRRDAPPDTQTTRAEPAPAGAPEIPTVGPQGKIVVADAPRRPMILDAQGRPIGGQSPPPTTPILYGPRGEPVSGMVWVNLRSGVYHTPDSPYFGRTAEGQFLPQDWVDALPFRQAYAPRSPITPRVVGDRTAESTGAGGSGVISARAATQRSMATAIRADQGESWAYNTALDRGEYGLQRPFGANLPGADFVTAKVERTPGPQGELRATIYINDAKTSGISSFPTPSGEVKPSWPQMAENAVAKMDLGDHDVEQAIRAALDEGRIVVRQVDVDFSPNRAGGDADRVTFREPQPMVVKK